MDGKNGREDVGRETKSKIDGGKKATVVEDKVCVFLLKVKSRSKYPALIKLQCTGIPFTLIGMTAYVVVK